MVYYDRYDSPMGQLLLTGDGQALTGLYFDRRIPDAAVTADPDLFCQAKSWLDSYFRGEPAEIGFLIRAEGTAFQRMVWEMLLQIPFGSCCSYGEIAREIERRTGKRMSSQAVGQAVGRNPIAIIIPCHRVIGAGGRLTGYAYGIHRKEWLLRHEQKQEE